MTVYVDEMREVTAPKAPHIKRWCHLLADTDAELEVFARLLGLRRSWKHNDHYDLAAKQRARAVALGAQEITSRQMVNVRRRAHGLPPIESIPPIAKCSGDCLRASDVGVGVAGNPVAHAHPDCPLHG